MGKVIREKRGFSLVEVLIGLILLAIGLLAIAGMQATSIRGNFSSNNVMEATYIAQDRLEFLINLPLGDALIEASDAGLHYDDGTTKISTGSYSSVAFSRSYTVTTVKDSTHGNYLRIDYVVAWNDGVDHSISLYTMRSQ